MENTTIDVLMVEAGTKPRMVKVLKSFDVFQKLVNPYSTFVSDLGYIKLSKNTIILYNKEGALLGLEGNRRVNNIIVAGAFFIVGIKNGRIAPLTKESQEKYYKRFEKIEKYTDKEVSDSYWNLWISTIEDMDD